MKLFKKQPGASLLTVLLLIAVIGVMVLAGSSALQETSRAAAVLSTREEAKNVAQTGMMEGLSVLATLPANDKEYGTFTDRTAATSYSLTPYRRGFTSLNGNCATQSGAEAVNASNSTIDKTCPYYDVAIRDRAAYGPGQTDISKFSLSSRDFPNGTAVIIPMRSISTSFTVVANGANISSVNFLPCTLSTTCIGGGTSVSYGGTYPFSDPTLMYHFLRVTVTYSALPVSPISVVTASAAVQQTVIGKGYTTIDVIGYSGDTQVRNVYTVRAGQPFLGELAGTFDQYGILK